MTLNRDEVMKVCLWKLVSCKVSVAKDVAKVVGATSSEGFLVLTDRLK